MNTGSNRNSSLYQNFDFFCIRSSYVLVETYIRSIELEFRIASNLLRTHFYNYKNCHFCFTELKLNEKSKITKGSVNFLAVTFQNVSWVIICPQCTFKI